MKRVLGSLLFLPALLFASYSWELKLAKETVFKEEPFLIEFICQFEGRDPDIYIEFKPKVDGIEFMRLDFTDDVIDNRRRVHYRYVARASKVGTLDLALGALMRETTEESIKETIIGRDNNQELVFKDTHVAIPVKKLYVEQTAMDNAVVGTFSIEERLSSSEVEAFTPVQLVRKIKGRGNFKEIPKMDLEIPGVKIFANDVVEKLRLTPKGYEGEMIWRFALISDRNFTIPAYALPYFNTTSKQKAVLELQSIPIAVKEGMKKSELLDDEIYPNETIVIDWAKHLKHLMLFLLGMLTLYLGQKVYRLYKKERPKAWYEDVKTVDALLLQLISRDSRKYQELIELIEANMQEKKRQSVKYYKLQLKALEG